MSRAEPSPKASKAVYFDTPNLYVRTLTVDDATDRWTSWFEQAEVRESLNLGPQSRTKADMIAYIRTFDQDTNILLGIFDRTNDLLTAIVTAEIDWGLGRYLANTIVGEADYRHRGVMLEISVPFRTYFFETLNLKVMTAAALATNKAIIGYLEKTGWTRNQTIKNRARSAVDGSPVDLHLYSITREAWNAWKEANPDLVAAMIAGTYHK